MSNVLDVTYHDICHEIELLVLRAVDLEKDIERKRRELLRTGGTHVKLVASYSGMPFSNYVSRPFDVLWEERRQLEMQLEDVLDVLSLKKECKKRMEAVMEKCESLEYKVAYLRDVKRKKLYEIANELGYTYEYTREISARVKRMKQPTKNQQSA